MCDAQVIGINIRSRRRKKEWSQRQLAGLAGLQPSQLCRIERGRNAPRLDTLDKIAKALGTSVTALLAA